VQDYLQAELGAQGKSRIGNYLLARDQLDAEALKYCCKNDGPFDQGELHTDADARAAAKGEIGEAMAIGGGIAEESLGLEGFGVFPEIGVAMGDPLAEDDDGIGGEGIAAHLIGLEGLAEFAPAGREDAHGFFEDGFAEGEML